MYSQLAILEHICSFPDFSIPRDHHLCIIAKQQPQQQTNNNNTNINGNIKI